MIIPKKVSIAAHSFKIIFPHLFKERLDIFGRYNIPGGEVMITNVDAAGVKCTASHIAVVFFHEMFHLLDVLYCLGQLGKECEKEDIIDGLAVGMVQFLETNFEPLIPKKVE